jgi:pimeloyl-ACP methyl ester carboxylesterase
VDARLQQTVTPTDHGGKRTPGFTQGMTEVRTGNGLEEATRLGPDRRSTARGWYLSAVLQLLAGGGWTSLLAGGGWTSLLAGGGWTSLLALPLIRQPTLILAGNDDPLIPLVNARIMRALLPDTEKRAGRAHRRR